MCKAHCDECREEVIVEDDDQLCCMDCYYKLKKDVVELLRINRKLEEALDSNPRPEQKGIQDA
jgi:uncharacterized Zn ribbon protein